MKNWTELRRNMREPAESSGAVLLSPSNLRFQTQKSQALGKDADGIWAAIQAERIQRQGILTAVCIVGMVCIGLRLAK
jgi:hypothetical protein